MLFSAFVIFDKPKIVNFTGFNLYSMKIIRFLVVVALAAVFVNGCKKDNQFVVQGKITHAEGKTIYLEELLLSSTNLVDSAKIDDSGDYKLKGKTGIPAFYLLKLDEGKFITLLVDSTDKITVNADFTNFSDDYFIEGSSGSKLVQDLNKKLASTRHTLDSLSSLNNLYRGNPDYELKKEQWEKEYDQAVQDQIDFSKKFVMDNPFSMASILALYQKFDGQNYVISDLQTMRVAASALNSVYPQSEHVKALYANTLQLLKNQSSANMQKFIQENGENSPDIVLPNVDGKEVALSSLRGKVVLVQFWAAVDQGSRILNPVLVEAYKKYKSKGFEIYQVSIDENRIEWVDAIDKDQLTWINVGDMKGSARAVQTYNIKAVPYNYLLDKDGVIVAQNLTGPALDRALAGVFK